MSKDKHTFTRTVYLTKRFIPYFKPYIGILALDLFCAALTALCELVLPMIIRYITDMGTTNLSALTVGTVFTIGGIYILMRIIDLGANFYTASMGHVMGARIETDLRRDMFNHLQELPNAYYDNTKVGQIMSRITTDLNDVTEFAHHFPEMLFIAVIKLVVSFILLSTMSVSLTLIVFAMLPVTVLAASYFNKRMRKAFMDSRKQLGELNASVEDSLQGIRVVKSFANEPIEIEKFRKGNEGFLKIKKNMYGWMAAFHSATRFCDGLMYILVVIVGSIYMINGVITAADLVAYLLYINTLLASVRSIADFMEQFQRGMTGIERFVEVMDEKATIHDLPDSAPMQEVKGEIEFKNVTFSYNDGGENVLDNVSLHIKAGDAVALVGPSGGGKTTMCNLIPRFYEVNSGSILIDGKDIKSFTLRTLREHIGVVQQDVYLFAGSVFENIVYGCPGATKEKVIEAAKMAGAHDFIMSLPNGYDTYVGERGVKLSGGQKQRISIARVFLKDPPILILDEATSALDNESEYLVQQSLEKLMKGRTTFTIAHRLTTIRGAKLILVLTDKGIEEQGSHDELMAKKGIYYNLQNMYTRRENRE